MDKTDFVGSLQEFGTKFEQAITGDLKWVVIAMIAISLFAVFGGAVLQAEADSREELEDA